MYTITIRLKEDIDKYLDNPLALVCIGNVFIVGKNGVFNRDTRTATFKNLTRKKAVKMVSKIKSIKNFEQIASYKIIKED